MIQPNKGKNKNINPKQAQKKPDNKPKKTAPPPAPVSMEQKVAKLGTFSLNMLRSIALWRLVGYALLFLFVLDLAEIFIPPSPLDPQWQFQSLGQVVERVPIPLISFLLIFYGGKYLRKSWEYIFLTASSWLTLLIGIFFILAVPLGVFSSIKIDKRTNENLQTRADQQLQVLTQVENALGTVQNSQQMQALIAQLNRGNAPIIENATQLEEAKSAIRDFIASNREQTNRQLKAGKEQAQKALIKKSAKWNIGALVSGALFITIWNMTKWARTKESMNEI